MGARGLAPTDAPHTRARARAVLFRGSRRGADGWLLSSMIVSSEPTAPSRLRSDQGRRGNSMPGGLPVVHRAPTFTPYGSGPSLWLTVWPLQPLRGRGWLRSALIAASWYRSQPPHIRVARFALPSRAGEVS